MTGWQWVVGMGADPTANSYGAAVWTLSLDLVPTTILGEEPPRHVAGVSLGSVLVGSYRTADDRWLSLNMLDPERHWVPTCRALGLED